MPLGASPALRLSNSISDFLSAGQSGISIPPVSADAQYLLDLSVEDKENPSVLALVAQKDPIYLGQVISYANSATFAQFAPTVSAEVSIRRIGVGPTHTLLVACALAGSFRGSELRPVCRGFLTRYLLSMAFTSRRLAGWVALSSSDTAKLWLGALLYGTGILAGLSIEGLIKGSFQAGLARIAPLNSFDVNGTPELTGFLRLSSAVASTWHAPGDVVTLLDEVAGHSSNSPVATRVGTLLNAVSTLVSLQSQGKDSSRVAQMLVNEGMSDADSSAFTDVRLAVVIG